MGDSTRRQFLAGSLSAAASLAVGAGVTGATSSERFLADGLDAAAARDAGLRVVHDLATIDLLVVEGAEADLDRLGADYVPNTVYTRHAPVDAQRDGDAETRDELLYDFQWDKQATNVPAAHDVTRGEGARSPSSTPASTPTTPTCGGR